MNTLLGMGMDDICNVIGNINVFDNNLKGMEIEINSNGNGNER